MAVFAFGFGTFACILAILFEREPTPPRPVQDVLVVVAFAGACALIAYNTLRRRDDVFPMALIAASWIATSTIFIATWSKMRELGMFLLLAAWVIVTSAVLGRVLMRWVRDWNAAREPAHKAPA